MMMGLPRATALGIAILASLMLLGSFAPRACAAVTAVLQCSIVDAAQGAAMPARCRVIDGTGSNRYPPPGVSLYHTAAGGYFYASGSFSVVVPVGSVVVHAAHGFEYREFVDTMSVQGDTAIVVSLERFVAMDGLGWYGGDSHVHINHAGGYYVLDPEDACRMGRAEGLSVVNCLDNAYHFLGAPDPSSTPDCIVYMAEEMRSSSYGHVDLLGISSVIEPFSPAWWPLLSDVADSVHGSPGALIISAHPVPSYDFFEVETWPGSGIARELPVDCITGRIDAMDVLSYSNCVSGNAELDLWYRLLNCGFRLPASAGTDAAVNRLDSNPPGGFRVYVRVPGGALEYGAWLENLAAGRSFITNGPLITHFEINGHSPGDSCRFAQPGALLAGTVSVRCASPFDLVEIVANGAPVLTFPLQPARSAFDTSFTLPITESLWIAARVHGVKRSWMPVGSYLFAHTSPVYCAVAGRRIVNRDDAAYFVQWIENLEALVQMKGEWTDPAQPLRVLGDFAAAREYYEALAFGNATGIDTSADPAVDAPGAFRCENAPNPFEGATSIDFVVPGPSESAAAGFRPAGEPRYHVSLAVYDVSGRVVRRLIEEPRAPGRYRIAWDGKDGGGRRAASGVYFARLSAGGSTVCRKMLIMR